MKDFQFYEDVMTNRGQEIKIFYDADEAKQWLFEN
jgi:hypothetical protein